ncbi:MalY/PatB family protein [Caproiciproducens sp. R2]|uniref:MalY/PatB family protein n=1 Tax=Caproiciproducens sp. R2 TaxID=3435187 RepID=UPI004034F415
MNSQFDQIIERKGTNSLKYDFAAERGKPEDVLPLWVADMDFKTSPFIIEALQKVAGHGIFGYSESKAGYFTALQSWYAQYFGWKLQSDWLVKTPGVVFAICMAIRALSKEGDSVLIQRPVYYPFSQSILDNDRKLVNNPLVYRDGKYQIDFEDFEEEIVRNKVKIFILCNPHNPVGRVWTKEELIRLGDICVKHGVYIVSDEIHADFVFEGHRHSVLANLKPEYLKRTITCTAPSKSFNLAGLQVSNILIANGEIRKKFQLEINRAGYSQLNTMGLVACQAAYENGRPWLEELKQYLAENLTFTRNFLSEKLPQIEMIEPEGTYLVWLDFRRLGLDDRQLEDLIVNRAKLWLDRGSIFGPEGKGFERVNIACPRATLQRALLQLEQAVNQQEI